MRQQFRRDRGYMRKISTNKNMGHVCYEENISMARGKTQHTEIPVEINSNINYDI